MREIKQVAFVISIKCVEHFLKISIALNMKVYIQFLSSDLFHFNFHGLLNFEVKSAEYMHSQVSNYRFKSLFEGIKRF